MTIEQLYARMGGASGALGPVRSPETDNLDGRGRHQAFARGYAYWHPDTGAVPVLRGAVWDAWAALATEQGPLGYPTHFALSPPQARIEEGDYRWVRHEGYLLAPATRPPEGTVPVHSWYSPSRGDYQLSSDPAITTPLRELLHPDYVHVRLEGYVHRPDAPQPAGTVPLLSWWSEARDDNQASADPRLTSPRRDALGPDYRYFRHEGYVIAPDVPQPAGTVPLHSWWSRERGDNRTSSDPAIAATPGTLVQTFQKGSITSVDGRAVAVRADGVVLPEREHRIVLETLRAESETSGMGSDEVKLTVVTSAARETRHARWSHFDVDSGETKRPDLTVYAGPMRPLLIVSLLGVEQESGSAANRARERFERRVGEVDAETLAPLLGWGDDDARLLTAATGVAGATLGAIVAGGSGFTVLVTVNGIVAGTVSGAAGGLVAGGIIGVVVGAVAGAVVGGILAGEAPDVIMLDRALLAPPALAALLAEEEDGPARLETTRPGHGITADGELLRGPGGSLLERRRYRSSGEGSEYVATYAHRFTVPLDPRRQRPPDYRWHRLEGYVGAPGPTPPDGMVPLHSWRSASRGDHHTTARPDFTSPPRARLEPDYRRVRHEGFVFAPDRPQPEGTVPLHRWYSGGRQDNHTSADPRFTTGPSDTLGPDYAHSRHEGYVHAPERPQPPGTLPLHSWWSARNGDNLTTTDPAWRPWQAPADMTWTVPAEP